MLHDPKMEPQPRLPYYHPNAEKVQHLGESIIDAAQQFLREHAYQGEESRYFVSWLDQRKKPQYECSNLRMILVGRSGAGKTLLLNAILNQPDLAIHVCFPRSSCSQY
jgi:putative ribosome biogenesis GTPase RsgA